MTHGMIKPPWTTEQVRALNDYQYSGKFHAYTCRDSWHRPLAASHDGWFCLDCDYTQDWAHAMSIEMMK